MTAALEVLPTLQGELVEEEEEADEEVDGSEGEEGRGAGARAGDAEPLPQVLEKLTLCGRVSHC